MTKTNTAHEEKSESKNSKDDSQDDEEDISDSDEEHNPNAYSKNKTFKHWIPSLNN